MRQALTLMLPQHLAKAITDAAYHAGRLDAEGRVEMDHLVLALPERMLNSMEKVSARLPAQTPLLEALFNGA